MLLCLVFVAGTVLDMVRTITVQPVVTRIAGCRGAHMPSYFKHIDKDSLDIFMLINDKSNEYLRLNQNVALSLLIIFILQQAHHIRWQNLLYLALTVAWVVIAVRSRRDLIAALNGFVEAQERAETAEAAAAARLPRPFPRLLRP
jgi:membrane protein required for beta-lactamase induction